LRGEGIAARARAPPPRCRRDRGAIGARDGRRRRGRRAPGEAAPRHPRTARPGPAFPPFSPSSPPLSGEIHELREDLRSLDRSRAKDAVKKVIAAMTVGKDVSALFPDVANCMQTGQ
jgi:hypothetical protein